MTASITLADECLLITKGTTPSTLGLGLRERGIPFIRAQNLVGGTVCIAADPLFIDRSTHDALRRSKIRPSDLLLSIAGTIGRAAIVPHDAEEMNCNQAVAIIRPTPKIDRRFLLHWLDSRDAKSQIAKGKVTATISNLSLEQIGNLKVPLFPLSEQQRIASLLDNADGLYRRRERTLGLLDRLSNAVFNDMFGEMVEDAAGHPTIPFAALVESQKIGLVRSANELQDDATTPYLRMNAITLDGRLELDGVKRTNTSTAELRDYELKTGDFLFNTRNSKDLVGKTAVFHGPKGYVYNNNILRVRFSPELLPEYAVAFFQTAFAKRELEARKAGTTSVFAIYQKSLETFPIAVPSIEAQTDFVDKVTKIRIAKRQNEKQGEKLTSLFSSLQHRAFSGQL